MLDGIGGTRAEGWLFRLLRQLFPESAARETDTLVHPPYAGFDLRMIYRWIWWSTAAVIVLGIFREVYVHNFGLDTVLKDLRHISLEQKHSFQAWHQSSLAFFGLLMTAALAASEPRETGLRRRWAVLAFIMAYISLDEQVTIHASSVVFMQKYLDLQGTFYVVPWVIWAIPLALALGAYLLPLLTRTPRRYAAGFVAGGAIFVGGSVGLEIIGGAFQTLYGGMDSWQYTIEFIAEESCESIGLAIFAVAILEYWRCARPDISVRLTYGTPPPSES